MFAHKMKWLRQSQKKFPALASDAAGNLGEESALAELEALLKDLNGPARIFRSLRVPKHQGKGKFEIDLLLVSAAGILVIEVKHWGGRLSQEKGQWIQERGRERKVLTDPTRLNAEKLQSLRHWLQQRGVRLPQGAVHSLVVLTQPQVSLDTALKRREDLVELVSLRAHAQLRCGQPRRRFWQKKAATVLDYKTVVSTLQQLPTWDRLELHGGQILLGDLEYVAVPQVKASALQRKYMQEAQVRVCRSVFPGLFFKPRLQVIHWTGGKTTFPLHPEAKLVFRPAGQSETREISWLHVETLQLGWKDQSYYNDD